MAKGAEEKQLVIDKIKEIFPNAFEYDKVLRIPIGEVQIKVALTCAKDNVEPGGDVALPGSTPIKATKIVINEGEEPVFEDVSNKISEPSETEINNVNNLLASLGL